MTCLPTGKNRKNRLEDGIAMLCERCKIREANIQYTEVINGVKTDHHFCSQCAKEMDFGQYSAIFEGEFPFANFLSALLGGESPSRKTGKYSQIVCPTCGMTYQEFVDNSSFGCADCYNVFDVLIHDNIKQIQGSDCHNGKRPVYQNQAEGTAGEEQAADMPADGGQGGSAREQTEEKIRVLEKKLRDALRMEEYETAATCRDQIRALRNGTEAGV